MKILIDLQCCQTQSQNRGIGRYSLAFAKAIAKHRRSHDVHILLNEINVDAVLSLRNEFRNLLPPENIHILKTPPFKAMNSSSWCYQSAHLIRESVIEKIAPDLVHVSSLFEWWDVPVSLPNMSSFYVTSVTLYDLIPLTMESALPDVPTAKAWYLDKIAQIKRADCVLAISESTMRDAAKLLNLRNSALFNIFAGVSPFFFESPSDVEQLLEKFVDENFPTRPFVLSVGTIERRKNFSALINAWGQMPTDLKQNHQLVIVGEQQCKATMNELLLALSKNGLGKNDVILLGDVNDEGLRTLYRSCKLFIMPSMSEGFGLPAAEAMVCGAPTVASNSTSLSEVIAMDAATFDPNDTEQIREILCKCLTDSVFLESLKEHAIKSANRFSWELVASKAIDAFEQQVLRQNKPRSQMKTEEGFGFETVKKLKTISFKPSYAEVTNSASAVAANRPRSFRQVLIDVTVLAVSDAKTGIQRVVRNYSQQLLRNPPAGHKVRLIRCYGNEWKYAIELEEKLLNQYGGKSDVREPLVEVFAHDFFVGADLGLHYIPQQTSWLNRLRARGCSVCFIVYDLLPILRPQFFHDGIIAHFLPWLKVIAEVSDRLVCISETVRAELIDWYERSGTDRNLLPQVSFVHMGADLDSQASNENDDGGYPFFGDEAEYTFLTVSTVEPRKGHEQLLDAFDTLWARGLDVKLIIVGKVGWNVEKLIRRIEAHELLGRKLIWLSNASDTILERCYGMATALVSCSYGEGFGLPLIEGAQRRLPLIVRDIPVFREVAKEHAFFFDATSSIELSDAILHWLSLFERNQHPKSDRMPWVTWRESADNLKSALGI